MIEDGQMIEIDAKGGRISNQKVDSIKKLQPYLLYVGNAHPHKNVEALIRSMEYINKVDKNLKLVLIGSDKFFYPRLEKVINKSPNPKSIVLIGEVPNNELKEWYRLASCLVTASKMEGFGIPPLEAMSVGCPVVVSDIPVFHEIYQDAAVYFDHNNPENIAETIIKTLQNKELLKEKIKKGLSLSSSYSWKKMTSETLEIYRELLKT